MVWHVFWLLYPLLAATRREFDTNCVVDRYRHYADIYGLRLMTDDGRTGKESHRGRAVITGDCVYGYLR